jgi:hypothetical protein
MNVLANDLNVALSCQAMDARTVATRGSRGHSQRNFECCIAAYDRLPICGLEQTLFSYDIPEAGIMNIYWYLHVNKRSQNVDMLSKRGYSMI